VKEALSKVTRGLDEPRRIRVRVSSSDAALIREVVEARGSNDEQRVLIEEDASLPPSSCFVDCDLRRVVIDVEHELERVREALLGDGGERE